MNVRRFSVKRLVNSSLLLFGIIFVTSCSETGGIDGVQVVEGGISGTGISSGSITGFSSVILNGRTLEITAQTEIYVDEQLDTVTSLKVGQVVRVEADFEDSTASRIDYVETVLGPLTSLPVFNIDTLEGSLQILGQSVSTNSVTVIDGMTDISMLGIGDVLEVSGVRNADGVIVARYINLKSSPVDNYRVLGVINGLSSSTFTIGNLTIDFSAADISDLGPAGIREGDEVRVRAGVSAFNGNVLVAEKISRSTLKVSLSSGDALELEGVITDFQSLSSMMVNGLAVNAADAIIENGTAGDLGLERLVEVEGQVDDSNILQATKVKIIPVSNIRVEASVEGVDLAGQSIEVLGQQYFADDKTQFRDRSSARISEFSLSDLNLGNWIELKAFRLDGQLILFSLERDEADSDVRIQGPVEALDKIGKTVTLLGITLSTDTNITEYENEADEPMSETDFFDSIGTNSIVKAKWKNFSDTSQPVDELSIED